MHSHLCCSESYCLKNGRVDNFYTPCLRRFIALHYDPLAQQTSCLKCLSGFTTQVWIPRFDVYIICLQEICGLLFSPPPLFPFSTLLAYLRLSVFPNQRTGIYLLQNSLRLQQTCMFWSEPCAETGWKIKMAVFCAEPLVWRGYENTLFLPHRSLLLAALSALGMVIRCVCVPAEAHIYVTPLRQRCFTIISDSIKRINRKHWL